MNITDKKAFEKNITNSWKNSKLNTTKNFSLIGWNNISLLQELWKLLFFSKIMIAPNGALVWMIVNKPYVTEQIKNESHESYGNRIRQAPAS